MHRAIIKSLAVVGTAVFAAAGTALAADTSGSFAVKGIGLERCERYVAEKTKDSGNYRLFLSWLNGYLTGYNQYVDETFDITPRTRISELADAFESYCTQNPQRSFLEGAISLTRTVSPRRQVSEAARADAGAAANGTPPAAAEASQAVSGQVEARLAQANRPAALVRESVRQGQQALYDLGLYRGNIDGVLGPETRTALAAFQRAEKLAPTGSFDRSTLARLMSK